VRWSDFAIKDLVSVRAYIKRDKPTATRGVALKITDAAKSLVQHTNIGRPGRVFGTREYVVPDTPYILAYKVEGDRVEILRVLHGARKFSSE